MADALTKHQRATLERLREELKDALYSRGEPVHGGREDSRGSEARRVAERNMRLRDQIDALDAVLRATAGEGA